MTSVKINPKLSKKDVAALPDLVATLGRITGVESRKADEAFAAMPANLTAGKSGPGEWKPAATGRLHS